MRGRKNESTERLVQSENLHTIAQEIKRARAAIEKLFPQNEEFVSAFDLIFAAFAASGMRVYLYKEALNPHKTQDVFVKEFNSGLTSNEVHLALDNALFLDIITDTVNSIHRTVSREISGAMTKTTIRSAVISMIYGAEQKILDQKNKSRT